MKQTNDGQNQWQADRPLCGVHCLLFIELYWFGDKLMVTITLIFIIGREIKSANTVWKIC